MILLPLEDSEDIALRCGGKWESDRTVSRLRILAISPHDLSGLAGARYPTLATALSPMYYGP